MPTPKKITLNKERAELDLQFGDTLYTLGAEFLRVHSPSAEVQGHGPGQKVTPLDKQDVAITDIEAQGNYAIRLIFSDGHDSGIYTWPYLFELCTNQAALWATYLEEAEQARAALRDTNPVKWV